MNRAEVHAELVDRFHLLNQSEEIVDTIMFVIQRHGGFDPMPGRETYKTQPKQPALPRIHISKDRERNCLVLDGDDPRGEPVRAYVHAQHLALDLSHPDRPVMRSQFREDQLEADKKAGVETIRHFLDRVSPDQHIAQGPIL
jgi:hypothetical protein